MRCALHGSGASCLSSCEEVENCTLQLPTQPHNTTFPHEFVLATMWMQEHTHTCRQLWTVLTALKAGPRCRQPHQ